MEEGYARRREYVIHAERDRSFKDEGKREVRGRGHDGLMGNWVERTDTEH